jgi:hypothetical protein
MTRHQPNLLVPIHDRRQHRRYLTLKNFGIVTLVLMALFVAISIRSEMRGRTPGEFGRLFQREVALDVQQKPVEVVHEAPAPVPDATHADPLLTEPMARAQWLQDQNASAMLIPAATTPVTTDVRPHGSDVAIVGGSEGVAVVQQERRKPVLSGGFGRQQ